MTSDRIYLDNAATTPLDPRSAGCDDALFDHSFWQSFFDIQLWQGNPHGY